MDGGNRAAGTLNIGIQRLLHRYPLLGGIVAAMNPTPMPDGTVAVGLGDGEFDLYYNPEFVSAIKLEELVGVLHHECRHLVYGHPLMTPEQYPDPEELTIAQETTANENLPEPLPCDPVLLEQYPQLPPDEDTETRYGRLGGRKGRPEDPNRAPEGEEDEDESSDSTSDDDQAQEDDNEDGCNSGCEPGSGAEKACAGDGSQDEAGNKIDADGGGGDGEDGGHANAGGGNGEDVGRDGAGSEDHGLANSQGGTGAHGGEAGVQTLDDHSRWAEIAADEPLARSLIESALAEAVERHGELSDEGMAVLAAAGEGWGIAPGSITALIEPEPKEARVDWRHQLRRYVGRQLDRSPSYSRPPRRFPHLVGVVPGVVRRSGRPKIMAAVDTSCSISDKMLVEISDELRHLARDHEIIVVECDTEIQAVYDYKRPITEVRGRGGTDLRPPLESSFLRKHRVDLAVFFTDGYGPAPDRKPQVPVLWALAPGGESPAAWGKVVKMEE